MKTPFIIILTFCLCIPALWLEASNETIRLPANGPYKEYFDNGKVKIETNFKNHLRHGISKTFYENGQVRFEYTYHNGRKIGPAKSYYPSGKLKALAQYKDDQINGIQKLFHENGKLHIEKKIRNGKVIYEREFTEDSQPVK